MAKWIRSPWNPNFISISKLFFPLNPVAKFFSDFYNWPDLEDYNHTLSSCNNVIRSELGCPIRFVEQGEKPQNWEADYEPRIYLDGEIQTRTENWHDFFQVLVWNIFPKTKVILNALHYESIRQRMAQDPKSRQRSPLENVLTQFDECGTIVCSSDPKLLDLIKTFQWKKLFWEHRDDLESRLRCFVFGHAIYEKAINPYPGLTARGILLDIPDSFIELSLQAQIKFVDATISNQFAQLAYQNPQDLTPFPVLGMPGWVNENHRPEYYDNKDYFRDGRRKK